MINPAVKRFKNFKITINKNVASAPRTQKAKFDDCQMIKKTKKNHISSFNL